MSSEPLSPPLPLVQRAEWNFWHGTPELLAQVVRTALRAITLDTPGEATCVIDIAVAEDHEVFTSPSEFTANVTREALRRFKAIQIDVRGPSFHVRVILRWRRPWWLPGLSKDAEVMLEVRGVDESNVSDAFATVRAAIRRGGTEREVPQALIALAATAFTVLGAVAGTTSILYLLRQSRTTIVVASSTVFVLGLVVGAVGGTWVYPSLEVARAGKTNMWRLVKAVGPTVLGLIVAGITKALYG